MGNYSITKKVRILEVEARVFIKLLSLITMRKLENIFNMPKRGSKSMTEAARFPWNLYPNFKASHRGAAVREHRLIGYAFVCPFSIWILPRAELQLNVERSPFSEDLPNPVMARVESISLRHWLTG